MKPKKMAVRVTSPLTPGDLVHVRGDLYAVVTAGAVTRRKPTRLEADEFSATEGDYQSVTVRPATPGERVTHLERKVAHAQRDVDFHEASVSRFEADAVKYPQAAAHYLNQARIAREVRLPDAMKLLRAAQAALEGV